MVFPGKIAIITSPANFSEDDFRSAAGLIAKYGEDKIIHRTWPDNFLHEPELMIATLAGLAADSEIKALIINQADAGTNAAVDRLKESRGDIFIVYCTTHEPVSEAVTFANLLITFNELGMGPAMVNQARKQGAKTFVHYSFPRHMTTVETLPRRLELIREECEKNGMLLLDITAADPEGEAGAEAARQFILEDVPRVVSKYGEDTAFVCTSCPLQVPLIKAVIKSHAIYPQPCCPSPFHGFPEALGLENAGLDLNYLISEACRIAEEKNMTDRLSTWSVSASMMFTNAGAEYAIKWIKDEVPKTGIDDEVLLDCINNYINEAVGEASNVYMHSYSENGISYENFKLILMSYLDF